MKINLISDSLYGEKCFYFEIIKGNNTVVSSDLGIARLFDLDTKQYTKRLIKAFNHSYAMDRGEIYLTFTNLGPLTEEELKNKFKEEFLIELIPIKLAD